MPYAMPQQPTIRSSSPAQQVVVDAKGATDLCCDSGTIYWRDKFGGKSMSFSEGRKINSL
jgi:hypothetical protein